MKYCSAHAPPHKQISSIVFEIKCKYILNKFYVERCAETNLPN